MGWANNSIFQTIIVQGAGGGEFVYDAAGNLRSANVGGVTKDPIQGITCQRGFSTFNGQSAVINLLSTANGAFFQYQDLGTSSQGPLILVVASTSGTDPVASTAYGAGMTGIDPAFGDSVVTVGANIGLNQVAYTRQAKIAAAIGSGANQPKLQLDAPEQSTASHLQMWMTGASPDASKLAQFVLAAVSGAGTLIPATAALLEVQGSLSQLAMSSITGSSFSNSIAETTIGTFTIPASEAQAGGTTIYDLTAHGTMQCALASNLTFRLRVTNPAGAQIVSTGAFACAVAAGVSRDWTADFRFAFRGSGSTNMDVWGQFIETISSGTTARPLVGPFVAVNDASPIVIAVTAQFSAANAGNSANGINGSLNRRNL